jgi:hypothetical protein
MQFFHLTNSKNKRKIDVPNPEMEEVINQRECENGKMGRCKNEMSGRLGRLGRLGRVRRRD